MQLSRLFAYGSLFLGLVATSANAQEQTQSDLDLILQDKTVRVGAIEAPPWYHQELATGKWVGIVPEISELIFEDIGVTVEYVPTNWGTAVAGLQSNKFDLVGAFNATPERALAIDFTDSIGEGITGVLTLKDNAEKYQSWESLNSPSIRVAAVDGAASTRSALRIIPDATWIMVQSNDAMLLELESGRADVILTNQATLLSYQEARERGAIVYPEPQLGSATNYGLRKTSYKEFRDWLDVAISYHRATGAIGEIWQRHLPTE